ncbi:MAG: 16S rRNA (guanine(527)-N(7))-methyltransferase RsmG [Bacteroidales bacterium]|nr:16S rRNA (guanine(527)-N(7))-methyltransferase RsmG [Bacteroidales bacterium]
METIIKYFPELSELQITKFSLLKDLYLFWNKRINVISRKDIDSIYEHHILHSLSIAKAVNFTDGTSVLDVGTGGGLPGIPLAIMFSSSSFTLIDSIGKKTKVVNEIVKELKLLNVNAKQIRVEKLNDKFDFIVSRAVTNFPDFYKLIKNNIYSNNINNIPNGIFYLKGGDFENEIKSFENKIKIINIADFFNEPYFETKKIIYLQRFL